MLICIALAGGLGDMTGMERQMRTKEAGLRPHILVGIGCAMGYGNMTVVNRDEQSGLCEFSIQVTLSRKSNDAHLYDKGMEIKGVHSLEKMSSA